MGYKKAIFCLFLACLIWVGQACSLKKEEGLKLALLPVEDNFPFFVAEEEGLFKKAGLKVELIPVNSARDRDILIQGKSVDGIEADIIAASLLRKGGTHVKIISLAMGATPEEGRFVLLLRPGSPIASPQGLKGATLGISENTIIEYVADRMLELSGVNPGEVQKVAVPQIPERLQLLLAGRLEAAVLPDPFATLAEQKGCRVLLDDSKMGTNLSQSVIIFREDSLKAKGQSVKKLLQIYNEAARMVSENPGKYYDLFLEKARIPGELKGVYLTPKYSPAQLPGRGEVEEVQRWMMAKGLLPQPYSYEELVDGSYLPGDTAK